MKYAWSILLLALLALSVACANNNDPNNNVNVSGNWSAALLDANGNQEFSFTTSLVQQSNNGVSGESLTFTTNSACFVDGGTETGAISINGNTSGVTSAGLQLNITSSGSSAGNTLTKMRKGCRNTSAATANPNAMTNNTTSRLRRAAFFALMRATGPPVGGTLRRAITCFLPWLA